MKFKKITSMFTVLCILFGCTFLNVNANSIPNSSVYTSIYVDGELLHLSVAPDVENGYTVVPLRDIADALGLDISWWDYNIGKETSDNGYSIQLTGNMMYLYFDLGDPNVIMCKPISWSTYINFPVAPQLYGDITFVPLRPIVELFNERIEWDEKNQSVYITTRRGDLVRRLKSCELNENNICYDEYQGYPSFSNILNVEPIEVSNHEGMQTYSYEYRDYNDVDLYKRTLMLEGWTKGIYLEQEDARIEYFQKGDKMIIIVTSWGNKNVSINLN